jgi:apolipoprotein N-acyltransferase
MGAVLEDDADVAMRRQFSRSLGVPALFGSVLAREVSDARKYALFNSALLTNKRGSVVGRFDKQLLLAFGEYLPFGETFPVLYEWSPHTGHFQSGTSFKPLSLDDHQIAVVICYEDVLPSFVNHEMREGEPELIANLTNDAWFGDTTEPWIHLALAKFRAVEQRKFFVRSTNSGVSAFVDPVGRVISHTKTFEQTSQRATLRWLKGKTLYTLWGDGPWWLASAGSIFFAFKRRGSKPAAETGTDGGPEPETGTGDRDGKPGRETGTGDREPEVGMGDREPEIGEAVPEKVEPAVSPEPDSALPGFPKPRDSKA